MDLLVREVPGGHQVIVANGVDGLAVRGADGVWTRVAIDVRPSGARIFPRALYGLGNGVDTELATALFIGVIGLLPPGVLIAVRTGRRCRTPWAALWTVLPGGCAALGIALTKLLWFFEPVFPAQVVCVPAVLGMAVGSLVQREIPRRRAIAVVVCAPLMAAAFAVPYLGWSAGRPMAYGDATDLAVLSTVVVFAGAMAVAWWAGRPPKESPPGG